MGDVVRLNTVTLVHESPEVVLEKAKTWGMTDCVIVGLGPGNELLFGGTTSCAGEIMILLEAAKRRCVKLSVVDDED